MIEVYTSFWANPELRDVDAVIASISRGSPRWRLGFSYKRLPELAPSRETFAIQDRESFERAYSEQLQALGPGRIMGDLRRISEEHGGRPVVMLCWEKPHEEWCHRWQLSDFLRVRGGIEIRELRPGDLPRRPDSPQQSLFELPREERG